MAEREPLSAPSRAGEETEPRVGGVLTAGALAAGLACAAQLAPALAPLALAAPVPLTLQRLRGGLGSGILATVLAASLVAALFPPGATLQFLLVLAAPGLLIGEAMARGRGLRRGCEWAFALLVAEVATGLLLAAGAMAARLIAPLEHLRSEAFLEEMRTSGLPPERLGAWSEQMEALSAALAVVFPAAYIIGAAMVVLASAGLLRLYLRRRDPGWLEDGEFERARWPFALVLAFVLSGAAVAFTPTRPLAYNALLVLGFFFALQGLAVVGFYARRLAAPPLLRAAVLVLVLANPWAPQILTLLGLFDNWFDFRRFAEPPRESGTPSGRGA
jgi:uncharacterized protein YybS (DUF2232 family)